MANQLLVEIHNQLSREIERSRLDRANAKSIKDHAAIAYNKGKLDELRLLRDYISSSFNLHTQQYH